MNILWHELKSNKASIIIWTITLALMVTLFLSLYPSFTKDIDATKQLLEGLPIQVRNALSISLELFYTIFGFYTYLFTFVVLIGAIQAMNIGVGIISKEKRLKTSDFLLTKPVTRNTVMTAKISAAFIMIVITNVVYNIVALTVAKFVSNAPFSTQTFVMESSVLFLVQLVFLVLGILFAVIIPRIKSVISITLPTVFAFFIIGMLDSVLGIEKIRYITPFKFYDFFYIIRNNSFETKFLIIEFIFIILAISASYLIFSKKDIAAAE